MPVLEELFGNVHPLPTPSQVSVAEPLSDSHNFLYNIVNFLLYKFMIVFFCFLLFLKQTTGTMVDNIRMAGYMEKLPVKSNQKKVSVTHLNYHLNH